ncbi:MAG: hypothetical protein ABSH48_05675 [Verrucomicrobiota bacterium]|jgi:hypothetical protein
MATTEYNPRADNGSAPGSAQGKAICILGMHRSGTSCVTRAMNLLGVFLGEPAKMEAPGPDNPKGFWEHRDIRWIQNGLLESLNRTWDTVQPLPRDWEKSDAVRPFKQALTDLVAAEFSTHSPWGWKEPQSCLLLPLWRDVLQSAKTELACLFMVRNPVDVAESLAARNGIPFNAGLGIWYHYNLVALRDAADLPVVFLGYERFLAQWETELRRSAFALGLAWPENETLLREEMNRFIDPGLWHNQSADDRLQSLPIPVQELYRTLTAGADAGSAQRAALQEIAGRLWGEFQAYASFFEPIPRPVRGSWPTRTWRRWQRSVGKRLFNRPA